MTNVLVQSWTIEPAKGDILIDSIPNERKKMGYKKYLGIVLILFIKLAVVANSAFGAWGTSTVDNTETTGHYTSIAVGTSGAAYISYRGNNNNNLVYATNVSGSWGTSTVDNTEDTGQYSSIAVGTSGAYISVIRMSRTPTSCMPRTSAAHGGRPRWIIRP